MLKLDSNLNNLGRLRDFVARFYVFSKFRHDPGLPPVQGLPDMRADNIGDATHRAVKWTFPSHGQPPKVANH